MRVGSEGNGLHITKCGYREWQHHTVEPWSSSSRLDTYRGIFPAATTNDRVLKSLCTEGGFFPPPFVVLFTKSRNLPRFLVIQSLIKNPAIIEKFIGSTVQKRALVLIQVINQQQSLEQTEMADLKIHVARHPSLKSC